MTPWRTTCRGCGRARRRGRHFYAISATDSRPRETCKRCARREGKAWARRNPAKHRAIWTRGNHRHNLKARFGLTVEQFDFLFAQCDGCCAICRKPETRKRRLSLDHDHETGELRGFICSRCNLLIGNAKDDAALLEAAAHYVKHARLEVPTG